MNDFNVPVNNDSCILVEFPNEDDYITSGYVQWMRPKDSADVDTIIKNKKIITVRWPKNIDVSEASVMNNLIKNNKIEWEEHPVRVLARGGWVQIRQDMRSMNKHGDIPSKDDRKFRCKRKMEDDDQDDDVDQKNEPPIKKSRGSKKNYIEDVSKGPHIDSPKDLYQDLDDSEDEEIRESGSNNQVPSALELEKDQIEEYDGSLTLQLDEEDEEEKEKKKEEEAGENSQSTVLEVNSGTNEAQTDDADMENHQLLIKEQLLTYLHALNCKIVSQGDQCNFTNCSTMKTVICHMGSCIAGECCNVPLCHSTKKQIHDHRNHCLQGDCNICMAVKKPTSILDTDSNTCRKNLKNAVVNGPTKMKEEAKNFIISDEVLKKAASKKDVEETAEFLLMQVFKKTEIATHSLTGSQSNANKQKGVTGIKPAIDQSRLKSVKDNTLIIWMKKGIDRQKTKCRLNLQIRKIFASIHRSHDLLQRLEAANRQLQGA